MNLDEIKQILALVTEHDLAEFELEQDGVKLRLRKGGAAAVAQSAAPVVAPAAPGPVAVAATPPAHAEPEAGDELGVMTAPIVGTFYRSPSPDAPPFVEIGTRVKKGQTLCIIEAMKLMNEIEAEHDGEIVKIYIENGQPVQFGDRLFAIRRG